MVPTLLLSLLVPAFAAPADALVQAFAGGETTADYVFLLDTAGPQKAGAEAAREDIAKFVEAVPAGDDVAIVVLHTRPSVVLEPVTVDEAGRAALAARIRAIELPTAKEEDVAAGLAQAGTLLDREGASTAQFLFVVSNFCHNPPIASEWGSAGQGCRAMRGTTALVGKLKGSGGRLLSSWVFPVAAEKAPAQADVDAAVAVLREAGAVELAASPFSTWLAGFRDRLATERVRPLARAEASRADLEVTVARPPTPDDPTAELRLSSGLEQLRLRLTQVDVAGALPGTWPTEIELAPEASLTVGVALPPPPVSILPRSETIRIPLVVRATGTVEPAEGLAALDVDTRRPDLSVPLELTLERPYGLSGPKAAVVLVATFGLSGFLGIWLRGRFLPKTLGGSFGYRRADGPRESLDISSLSVAPIVIGKDGRLAVGSEKDAVLVLRIRRPLWVAHAEVEVRGPREVEINRKRAAPGRHRVVAGATSFQFGEYRLTWE
ncbi:MAG: hypothetical protein ACOZNI_35605 [Myxococcota bacterium]